jgi:phosphoglycolate phosphatase-like HAD superfamily hydrolase
MHTHTHMHMHMHMPQVMIGDSWSDIVAAQRAGCVGVLVVTGQLSVA